jgi:hypothetical protein
MQICSLCITLFALESSWVGVLDHVLVVGVLDANEAGVDVGLSVLCIPSPTFSTLSEVGSYKARNRF